MKNQTDNPPKEPLSQAMWHYREYQMEGSTFATAMVHLYRGELTRANVWRSRLDVTTNWAVVSTGAALSFAFAQPETHHSVILLITVLVTLFWMIEARRYRYYELWSYRIRLLETDFYAAMLVPPFHPGPNWSKNLAESLLHPQFPITLWEALGRRLRRNYIWIYLILGGAWVGKLLLYPTGVNSIDELRERARMGAVHGWTVLLVVGIFYISLTLIGILTYRLRLASGEVLHREAGEIKHMAATIATNPADPSHADSLKGPENRSESG